MKKIKIVTDSTCDLPEDILKRYDITRIPLCIVMDGKSYYDMEEVVPEEIFAWADEQKKTPTTSAITFEKTAEIIKPFVEDECAIIFICISEQMSVTCNVMRMMKEEFSYHDIYAIDSMNLSVGVGELAIYAAELAREGMNAGDIVTKVEMARNNVKTSFLVDTLTYLARGGRCKAVTALLANTLQLKPKIIVENGTMGVSKKYRGNINSSLIKYANELEIDLISANKKRVYIAHSGCDEAVVNKIYAYLDELKYFEEIIVTRVGGVISSHCGPNTLGIVYRKEK